GNVNIQIDPETEITVKKSDLKRAFNQNQKIEELFKSDKDKPIKIRQEKFNEIIILSEVKNLRKFNRNSKEMIPDKSQFKSVKDLVGKRVNIKWKSGKNKGCHRGTDIGFTSNLINNLISHDQRNNNVDPAVDYYSHNLLSDPNFEWKIQMEIFKETKNLSHQI